MALFSVAFVLATWADHPDPLGNVQERRNRANEEAFRLGPAWHADWNAIFVRSELSIDEATARLASVVSDSDVVLVAELDEATQTRFAGLIHDRAGFEAIFPQAVEVPATGLPPPGAPPQQELGYEVRSARIGASLDRNG